MYVEVSAFFGGGPYSICAEFDHESNHFITVIPFISDEIATPIPSAVSTSHWEISA